MSKLFKHEPLPETLTNEYLVDFYNTITKESLEDLYTRSENLENTILDMEVNLSDDFRDTILTFINAKERIQVYGASQWEAIDGVLSKISDKSNKTLNFNDILVLRLLLSESKLTNIDAIKTIGLPTLNLLKPINFEINNVDQLSKMVMEQINKKRKEEKTGLEFSEENADNEKALLGLK